MYHPRKPFPLIIIILLILSGCVPSISTITSSAEPQTNIVTETRVPGQISTETPIVLEPTKSVAVINPLTGLPVQNPALLDLPAVLVSIAHFPPAARPQSG